MNNLTIILGLALIAFAAAHGGESYVKRSDHHGYHSVVSHHGGHGGDDGGHGGHGGHDGGHDGGHHDYYHHPSYKFEYGVKDPHTKDHPSVTLVSLPLQQFPLITLDEADGTKRVVKYTSDKKSGFNAVVEKIGHAQHPAHYGHQEHHGHY
ncbi:CLUMA_CG018086, isoform A [Clunio marinus]|uniref:CLUMA_CG018086, isoform A n=1 Tax=Clunio marinus TaxID=568069 RepID=A0A1J1J229_9DIPT|nr:CLUMA_CG018086, isoform A [Clunio marinus]